MKYMLGYVLELDRLIHFGSEAEAEDICEDWCEVEAESLEEAKAKYEETFLAFQKRQNKLPNQEEAGCEFAFDVSFRAVAKVMATGRQEAALAIAALMGKKGWHYEIKQITRDCFATGSAQAMPAGQSQEAAKGEGI